MGAEQGSPQEITYAVFPSYEDGKAAADAFWDRAANDGLTIAQAVRKYVGKDENRQEQRNRAIEKELGVSRNVDVGRLEGNLLGVLKDYNRQLEGEIHDRKSGKRKEFP